MKKILKKYRLTLLLFFLILFNIGLSIQFYFLKQQENSKVTEVIHFQNATPEKKMIEEKHPYQLRVYYPITSYPTLNQEIDAKVQSHIQDFKDEISDSGVQLNQTYTLDILYKEFQKGPYISYVFTIFQDTGGAHPNTFYDTISYNTKTNQMVTLEDLIKENLNFLDIVSENTREQLSKNKKIVSYDMMIQGTLPKIENFSQFAITEKGYLFFFSPYQVAPYSSGKFQVLLPYSLFEKN